MLTDEEAAAIKAAHAADPGVEPDAFTSVAIDKCVDQRAWISEQMESWHKEGMRYVRVTEDSAHNILWAEFWKVPPRKEAPFHGWYTSSHPTTEK